MAFYLEIAPSTTNTVVALDSLVSPPASFNLEFEIDVTGTQAVLFAKRFTGGGLIFFTDLNTLNIRINNVQNNLTLNTSAEGRHKYNIVKTASVIELFQDDVSCGSFSSSDFYTFETLVNFNNNTSRAFNFYYAKLSDGNGTVLHDWNKQTLIGSNDILLPDTFADNNGRLVDFPTDNSQWLFYDDGGGAVDKTIELPLVTSSSTLFQLEITKDKLIQLNSITSTENVRNPSFQQELRITLDSIESGVSVRNLSLLKDKLIQLSSKLSSAVVYDQELRLPKNIQLDTLSSEEVMYLQEIIGGFRPLPEIRMYNAEGYGMHIRTGEELKRIIVELSKRIDILEGR